MAVARNQALDGLVSAHGEPLPNTTGGWGWRSRDLRTFIVSPAMTGRAPTSCNAPSITLK